MGRYGAAILTIAGTVVGAYFGYPALGAFLGSLAGQFLFPGVLPTQNGPRLSDLSQTVGSVGAPIPRGWGTWPSPGAFTAKSDVREVIESSEVGGKGTPSQTSNIPTYFQDFALGLNDGEIGGVRTIWANGKAIYDRRPQRDDESDADFQTRQIASDKAAQGFTVYLGTETQMPDPTLEAFYGVGNISAFRGLAYIVFIDWENKPEDGQRPPASWKFELYSVGEVVLGDDTEYSNEVLYDWIPGGNPIDWRNTIYIAPFNHTGNAPADAGFIYNDLILGQEHFETEMGRLCGLLNWPVEYVTQVSFASRQVGNGYPDIAGGPAADNETYRLNMYYGPFEPEQVQRYDADGTFFPDSFAPGTLGFNITWSFWQVLNIDADDTSPVPPPPYGTLFDDGKADGATRGAVWWWQYTAPIYVQVDRRPGPPSDPCSGRAMLGEVSGYCIGADGRAARAGDWVFDPVGIYLVPQTFLGLLPLISDAPTRYPLNPCVPRDQDPGEAFWRAQYESLRSAGKMPAGLTYVPGGASDGDQGSYPIARTGGYYRTRETTVITTDEYPVATIVRDLCMEATLTADQIDVTDLAELTTIGYVRTKQMPIRSALDPLRQACFFDGIESDPGVKFVRRGRAISLTLTDDDLAAAVQGDTPPSKLAVTRAQDVDLPRSVRVHYLSQARDYEPGEQDSPARLDTEAVNDMDVEIPMVVSDTQAKRIATGLWADAWAGVNNYQIAIDFQRQELEPCDVLAVPVNGLLQRARIASITDVLPAVRKLELISDDDAAFVSTAVASPPIYVPPPISFASPIDFVLLDLPALRDSDDDAGFYAVARPLFEGTWKGGTLFRSVDGGGSFSSVTGFSTPALSGRMLNAPVSAVLDVFDYTGELLVDVLAGTPESRTEDAVQAGANAAAIGAHGRWCIVQYLTAENISGTTWKLTGLLWGRRGTELHANTTVAGDDFVLLSGTGVVRVPLEQSQIGAEFQYRGVAPGGNLSAAPTTDFTGTGKALQPFFPVQLQIDRENLYDLRLAWIRRGRLGQELQSGVDIPVSETSESYEIDIATAGGTVLTTLTATTSSYLFTEAAQAAIFPDVTAEFQMLVYQMSDKVGRGEGNSLLSPFDANPRALGADAVPDPAAEPFVVDNLDAPMPIAFNDGKFIVTRKGTQGAASVLGFYSWDGATDPVQFDTSFDGLHARYVPDSYSPAEEGLGRIPVVAAGVDNEYAMFWRSQPDQDGPALRFLYVSASTGSALTSVPPTDPVLATVKIIGLLRDGTDTWAIAATNDVYKTSDAGATWNFQGNTTGLNAPFIGVNVLRLFQFGGQTYCFSNGQGLYVNADNALLNWALIAGGGMLAPGATYDQVAFIDVANTATEIVFMATAHKISDGLNYQKILRSTDGATWTEERSVDYASDLAPGFAFQVDWNFIVPFSSGYAIYGHARDVGAFPQVLLSVDAGVSWLAYGMSGTSDQQLFRAISSGSMIVALDYAGTRVVAGASQSYYRISYSTDAVNFTAVAGF